MPVVANILDPIHDTLSPKIWDDAGAPEPRLKPHVADFIKHTIYHALESNGYARPKEWLHLVLTGSLTTYQYSDESDCDISLFVDAEVFLEWSRAEMIGIMIDHCDGVKVPGSPYVLQDYVVPAHIKPADLYRPGLRSGWDVDQQRWITPPERARTHDVQAQENGFYVYALEQADKMERLLRYEPAKAKNFWHQIHERRRRDMAKGKGDFSESNIVYKFLANRGLFPQISEATGEYLAKTAAGGLNPLWEDNAGMVPQTMQPVTPPIRPGELSSPTAIDRGHSRPVSIEEWNQLAQEGRRRYETMAQQADGAQGLDSNWPGLVEHSWQSVQQPWGGTTINAATGVPLQGNEDLYALTVKEPGMDTVSIPINASREHFEQAMAEARKRFGHLLERANHHLGVFRDEDVKRLDFDPVLVTPDHNDVETIGAHTRNVGGAYHFASGDGFWPPHVPAHLAAGWQGQPGPYDTYAMFRAANRTEPPAPLWVPEVQADPWNL